MEKETLKELIEVAAGRKKADLVIKNGKIVDVYTGSLIDGDVAVYNGKIAGIGQYEGVETIDAEGKFIAPGFIDGHIHIESSYVSPEEMGRLLVPHGTTTIMADPHEIVNVSGMDGFNYMVEAGKNTALDIKYMLPSCVPATPFEHAGAILDDKAIKENITNTDVWGLGEYMNFPGVIGAMDMDMGKLSAAHEAGKPIDGHCPNVRGNALNAYIAARILADHECADLEEMQEKLSRGMYILLREGSACHDLRPLLKGVTPANSRRCMLCSDDRQPKTILELGHLNNHLKICVEEGIDPVTAITMATLNAAECFGMSDRGAIAPGLRADLVILKDLSEDLSEFEAEQVYIEGKLTAKAGNYLLPVKKHDYTSVGNSFHVKDFSKDKLKMHLKSGHVNVIDILPGGVVTGKGIADVVLDERGDFMYQPEEDIVKIAVIERHHGTGNVAVALLRGYGIKAGAVALSVAHDSHNIIVAGTNDEDMEKAVTLLIEQNGGIMLVKDGKCIDTMPFPIGGLMSDQSGEWVKDKLVEIHDHARDVLKINGSVDPVMTLCFMALPVIPELKLTDMGLFDVTIFDFISVEAE